jgi:ferredoxin-type protein NapF
MNLASFFANKCFEFLLHCDVDKGSGHLSLTGRRAGKCAPSSHRLLPPPWAIEEQGFRSKCDGCRACLESCENKILIADSNGFPVVDFSRGACSFCGACAASCSREALSPVPSRPPWEIKAWITGDCLAHNNVLCRTCAEHCPEDAIIFPQQPGAVSTPKILMEKCSGCGACFSPCPTCAIAMRREDENHKTGGNR